MSASEYIDRFYGTALASETFSVELQSLIRKHQLRVLRAEQRAAKTPRKVAA